MRSQLEQIKENALKELHDCLEGKGLDALRVKYLGKKGELTTILKQMGKLSAEERPVIGQMANEVRQTLEDAIPLVVGKTLGEYKNVLGAVRNQFADRDAFCAYAGCGPHWNLEGTR